MKNYVLALLIVVALAGWMVGSAPAASDRAGSIIGSWNIAVTLPNQPGPVLAMATATSDGTVVQTGAVPHVSTGHGIWARTGDHNFVIQSQYFRFDADGNPIGTSVTTTTANVDKSGDTATGHYDNVLFDLAGNQVGGFSGPMSATRMAFAAP